MSLVLYNLSYVRIVNHVREVGCFQEGCVKGLYDNLNFTPSDWHSFIKYLNKKIALTDVSDDVVLVLEGCFFVGNEEFVYRHLEMGSYCDQIMTAAYYHEQGFDEPMGDL